MSAELVYVSPIKLIVGAIRKCYLSEGNSDSDNVFIGMKDKDLVKRIIKSEHTSTLEHSLITFDINISRALLQELSRHRIGVSPSVQSTRYTLKKILSCPDVNLGDFLYDSGSESINQLNLTQLESLKSIIEIEGIPNDVSKYGIPEALLITERISFNWRSFRHFISLRTENRALKEIQNLATDMIDCIPAQYMFLIEDL